MEYKWYIAHTLSGSENKVKRAILENAQKNNMTEYFEEIFVPVVEVPDVKRGKQVTTEKKFLPGYILIKMCLTDQAWQLVKSIPKVSGFLGTSQKPLPVSEREVKKIIDQLKDTNIVSKSNKVFDIGETVKVLDGPFESFVGTVEDVDIEKMRLRVSVSIFGKATPIDLNFNQVERI